ncbi:hypothetical protein B0H10DRAFT_1953196 [Mycena sp. CBHHK59/15]|nr:hypothetical protein B0H10DRAFT_1953196 [Mycena sp. CBHHK59/15]
MPYPFGTITCRGTSDQESTFRRRQRLHEVVMDRPHDFRDRYVRFPVTRKDPDTPQEFLVHLESPDMRDVNTQIGSMGMLLSKVRPRSTAIGHGVEQTRPQAKEIPTGRSADTLADPAFVDIGRDSVGTLRPLLAFNNLLSVRVEPPFRICLDDDFVEAMAMAWPCVADITFDSKYVEGEPSPPPSVSLTDFSAFARHCPDLHTLRMPINATNIPAPPSTVSWPTQTSFNYLHVSDSPIDSAFAAAAFLSSVFPALVEILTSRQSGIIENGDEPELEPADAEAHAKWKEVEKLVPMFAKIREEDEMR